MLPCIVIDFFFKEPTRRTNYSNLFCHKTLHVSIIFSAHHQDFSTVHSAAVSFLPLSDDRFQAESGWTLLEKRLSKTCMKLIAAECIVQNS
jgi:hypothetical protein